MEEIQFQINNDMSAEKWKDKEKNCPQILKTGMQGNFSENISHS